MRSKTINPYKVIMGNIFRLSIIFFVLFVSMIWASGGYDHGTATGKGKLQLDLTWNPFNIFENGQSYVVFGYGITNRLDIHGYYCDHGNYHNGVDSYYYGLFYQFVDSKYIDFATAIGKRKMMDLDYSHVFFPQILFNIKLGKGYTIGGSSVNIIKGSELFSKGQNKSWLTFDIALFIPLTKYFQKINRIEEIKVGIGVFNNQLNEQNNSLLYLPTYSIDIKLNKL